MRISRGKPYLTAAFRPEQAGGQQKTVAVERATFFEGKPDAANAERNAEVPLRVRYVEMR